MLFLLAMLFPTTDSTKRQVQKPVAMEMTLNTVPGVGKRAQSLEAVLLGFVTVRLHHKAMTCKYVGYCACISEANA